jgi:EAL domain-containing protein (putative c-di-GMP-specific phosphodiesterase class I)/GGDEF domain-containing protein
MSIAAARSMLGVVELLDASGLADTHGRDSFSRMRDTYIERLKNWARAGDPWRLVGDHRFCVVLSGVTSPAELELATAKLARVFEQPYEYLGKSIPLEVAAGFTSMAGANLENDIAIRQASMALRVARSSSRLYEVYGPGCEPSAADERGLVRKLEAAVELGELELYFQPKVHAGFRNLLGAEALMRWHTSEREVLTPDQFIGVAERNDVIKPMTWWAIKSAISRLSRWPEGLSIAVNIAPTLLLDDEILAVVKDSLEIHGVAAQRLNLEVTESVMVDNQGIMFTQLARLREIGVKISIDDFGTGFSSLAYFRDLPADEIKIDKGFVIPMLSSKKDFAIVKAVIDLAHNFSLKVVAEGVEDEDIATTLTKMRCDVLQGYLFDRPLVIEDFEKRHIKQAAPR